MNSFFINQPWNLVLLAVAMHLVDYALTLRGARLYAGQDRYTAEGSYELNPAFSQDINNLRKISPRFLIRLAVCTLFYICLVWSFKAYSASEDSFPEATIVFFNMMFGMVIGSLTYLIERHLFNIFLFRNLANRAFSDGHLRYPRSSTYAISAALFRIQSLVALLYAVLLAEAFFAGTALMLWMLSQQHTALGKRIASEEAAAAKGEVLPPDPPPIKQVIRFLLLLVGSLIVTVLLLLLLAYILG